MASRLSNIDLVLSVLLEMEGDVRPIHLEDLAIECHRLYPHRFGWVLPKYADRVDKEPVRFALEDAKKAKNYYAGQPLVRGRSGVTVGDKQPEGWQLTPAGLDYLRSRGLVGSREEQVRQGPKGRAAIDRAIRRSEAWAIFQKAGSLEHATELQLRDLVEFPRSGDRRAFLEAAWRFARGLQRSSEAGVASLGASLEQWCKKESAEKRERDD